MKRDFQSLNYFYFLLVVLGNLLSYSRMLVHIISSRSKASQLRLAAQNIKALNIVADNSHDNLVDAGRCIKKFGTSYNKRYYSNLAEASRKMNTQLVTEKLFTPLRIAN